jgi:hypothetical protein
MIVQIDYLYKDPVSKANLSEIWDIVYCYYNSGQILCDSGIVFTKSKRKITFIGKVLFSFSMNDEFKNRHVRKAEKELIDSGVQIKIKNNGININNFDIKFYDLKPETDRLVISFDDDASSPISLIRDGKIFNYPLFLIPYLKKDETYWNFNSFFRLYYNTRKLYFDGLDDKYFEDQLFNSKKFILKTAKKYCLQIQELTKTKCYFNYEVDVSDKILKKYFDRNQFKTLTTNYYNIISEKRKLVGSVQRKDF